MALPAGIGSPIHPALPSPFPYTRGRINHSFCFLLRERCFRMFRWLATLCNFTVGGVNPSLLNSIICSCKNSRHLSGNAAEFHNMIP